MTRCHQINCLPHCYDVPLNLLPVDSNATMSSTFLVCKFYGTMWFVMFTFIISFEIPVIIILLVGKMFTIILYLKNENIIYFLTFRK